MNKLQTQHYHVKMTLYAFLESLLLRMLPCASFTHKASSSEHWIIDSSYTSHVTDDRSAFTSYTATSVVSNLDLGRDINSSAPIVGRGDVRLDLCMPDGSIKSCLVKNALHVPDLRYQLLSVSAMSKLGV